MTSLISIVIPTKNSLPHLKKAIEGIRRQTYKNFELIIQDGSSNDGTLEYLSTIQGLKIDIQSEPDNGIGQAYNRGILRTKGDYLFLAASDEWLFETALENLIFWHKKHPSAAVIYGGVLLVNQIGQTLSRFIPEPFDFHKFMRCDLIPPTSGLLNRKVIGTDLFYDESLKTCPDYDFWLRLGYRVSSNQIIHRKELIMTSLADRTSMSYRAEAFNQFCEDKLFILDRFLADKAIQLRNEHFKAKAGIFTWAAKEVMNIEGLSTNAIKFYEEADNYHLKIDMPPLLSHDIRIAYSFFYHGAMTKWLPRLKRWYFKKKYVYTNLIFGMFRMIFKKTRLPELKKQPFNIHFPIRIKGGRNPWEYLAEASFDGTLELNRNTQYWIKIRMKVVSGVIGVCFMEESKCQKEKFFPSKPKEIITCYPIRNCRNFSVIFRKGGLKNSGIEIYELSIVRSTDSHEDVS